MRVHQECNRHTVLDIPSAAVHLVAKHVLRGADLDGDVWRQHDLVRDEPVDVCSLML